MRLYQTICLALTGGFTIGCSYGVLRVPKEYPSIQAAIDAAKPEEEVRVAPGTYIETIVLKDGVIVRSEGSVEEHRNHTAARRTIIDANGELKPVVEGADGAVIDGFTLTGLGQVDHHKPGHPHGVQCRGASAIIINNIVHHNGSTGIGSHVKNGKPANPWIENNIVYANYGLGIGSNHESAATIINNVVYSNEELGIGIKNGAHPLVYGNTVYGNNLSGIGTKDGAFPAISHNTSRQNGVRHLPFQGAGISAQNTYVPLIEYNQCYQNDTAGIGMQDGAQTVISGNNIYENHTLGIALKDGAYADINRNDIHNNGLGGVRLDASASGVLNNNHIYQNGMGGILLAPQTNVQIKENLINKNYGTGINPSPPGPSVSLENNTVVSNTDMGINMLQMFSPQNPPPWIAPKGMSPKSAPLGEHTGDDEVL